MLEAPADFWFWMGIGFGTVVAGAGALFLLSRLQRHYHQHLNIITRQRKTVAAYMDDWVRAIGEGSSRKELLDGLLKTAQAATGATQAAVFERRTDGTLQAATTSGLFPPLRPLQKFSTRAEGIDHLLKRETYREGDGLLGEVAKTQKAIFVEDAIKDACVFHHGDPSLELRSLILAPIIFRETLLGVLALANPKGLRLFSSVDFRVASSLAEQAALAIHNADAIRMRLAQHRFDLDLSVASSIQTMLLPNTFPENTALDIAARYHPAQKVGGDLYDVFELPEGLVGIVIADVSGKGIPASLLMAICQSHLRHLARKHHSPARVLCELNQILEPEIRQDMFVTVSYAVLDPEANEMILARAGHELPLKISRGKCEFLKSNGMAVGLAGQSIFESAINEKRFSFAKGDMLVMYTDGVTEAVNSLGEEFSARRLADVAQQCDGNSADQTNTQILRTLGNFTSRRTQDDDITLLTIKHL